MLSVSLCQQRTKRNKLFVSRTKLDVYYVRPLRAVLNLLSLRNLARYIEVHFVPREVLQSLLRFNIAQKQFFPVLSQRVFDILNLSFSNGLKGLFSAIRYELHIKDYSFPWAILPSRSEMAAGVHEADLCFTEKAGCCQ